MWVIFAQVEVISRMVPTAKEAADMSDDGMIKWIVVALLSAFFVLGVAWYKLSSKNQDTLFGLLTEQNKDNRKANETIAVTVASLASSTKDIATTTQQTGECVGEIHTQMKLQTQIMNAMASR